jgi:hypothetical protein
MPPTKTPRCSWPSRSSRSLGRTVLCALGNRRQARRRIYSLAPPISIAAASLVRRLDDPPA